ncbi:hypothetical protein N7510_004272 [Penicillium lagena]|uniref:uncharacterized protein n=1 Tax=Penicillium lagena TaxID=94218 RepID=UPI00254107A5|nr:uncharacterized protein N7510_004272 [Penicillium lagena]KAJ5620288.1 hypothetical protein N7510_004272 [Penicillium lagena]
MTSSPLLLNAVISVSAQHRANSTKDDKMVFQTAATSYYLRSLSSLKHWIPYISSLQEASACYDFEALEIVLLASIFLCKHEIIKAGVANWRHHLLGIESFCQFLEMHQPAHMTETIMYARSL